MTRTLLQEMVDDLTLAALPPSWNSFNLSLFSGVKALYSYQEKALERALIGLWKYYEQFTDFQPGEAAETGEQRQQRMLDWYHTKDDRLNLDIPLASARRDIRRLLQPYFPQEEETISYRHFINRMSFWMATGSGKTLVLIKLIEFLHQLIRQCEIPPNDLLILTYREDLIIQLQKLVNEYNAAPGNPFIRLRDLKEFPEAKRSPSLLDSNDITVFIYRSDNLSDEQKDRIIDFRNYDSDGHWYILLDEAHKGDKEDSKRQHIYSLMARNGFLFNFSATFTDKRDIATTISNFNLSEFVRQKYGKHLALLKREIRQFRRNQDYSEEEKQRIVLKTLILLAYVRKQQEALPLDQPIRYHHPMMLTLVNSVNTTDADLKRFFRELERIGRGQVESPTFNATLEELWDEIRLLSDYTFEPDQRLVIHEESFRSLEYQDVLRLVFNLEGKGERGEIEVLVRPTNRNEMAFKLKASDRPFALVKIGDVSDWLRKELQGYEINQSFSDETYFERLNQDDSSINLLMGSRAFYEGWDSNRPNVICFINIGLGEQAQKFLLQSIGRGVRIEPLPGVRRRLSVLSNEGRVTDQQYQALKASADVLETLFIFGTSRDVVEKIVEGLSQEGANAEEKVISLVRNPQAEYCRLLIPVYRFSSPEAGKDQRVARFDATRHDVELLTSYFNYLEDDRVRLMLFNSTPQTLVRLKTTLEQPRENYTFEGEGYKYKNPTLLGQRVLRYFSIVPKELDHLKKLEEEIRHYKNIKVTLEDLREFEAKIILVSKALESRQRIRELTQAVREGRVDPDELVRAVQEKGEEKDSFESDGKKIEIKYVTNHYYIPLLIDEKERADYIRHIIHTESEARFIREIEIYLKTSNNLFAKFDWWMFSKIDESIDEVGIPYYDPAVNAIVNFRPDFIFWLQKGSNYSIAFIDPKGPAFASYQYKLDYYRRIFETDEHTRVINHDGLNVRVHVYLYPPSPAYVAPEGYQRYWKNTIHEILRDIQV